MTKIFIIISIFTTAAFADLNIYADRDPAVLKEISKAFEEETGNSVNVLEVGYPEIKGRLELEGDGSPADIVIYKDMVYMNDLENTGLLQSLPETVDTTKVAPSLKSDTFVAISMRPRTVVYSSERVSDTENLSYKGLADPKWQGRLCLRTSTNSYSKGLTAAMVADLGADETANILSGWVENLAVSPLFGDTAILNAIADGTCDVGLVNSYYYVRALENNPNFPVSISLKNVPYVNGVAVGMVNASQKNESVAQFINYLLSDKTQSLISNINQQYSTTNLALSNKIAVGFGPFEYSQIPWATVENVNIADEVSEAVSYE